MWIRKSTSTYSSREIEREYAEVATLYTHHSKPWSRSFDDQLPEESCQSSLPYPKFKPKDAYFPRNLFLTPMILSEA